RTIRAPELQKDMASCDGLENAALGELTGIYHGSGSTQFSGLAGVCGRGMMVAAADGGNAVTLIQTRLPKRDAGEHGVGIVAIDGFDGVEERKVSRRGPAAAHAALSRRAR